MSKNVVALSQTRLKIAWAFGVDKLKVSSVSSGSVSFKRGRVYIRQTFLEANSNATCLINVMSASALRSRSLLVIWSAKMFANPLTSIAILNLVDHPTRLTAAVIAYHSQRKKE